jgi:hypothetical protein
MVACVLPSSTHPVASSAKRILASLMSLCAYESRRLKSAQGCKKSSGSCLGSIDLRGRMAPHAIVTRCGLPFLLRHLPGSSPASTGTPGKVAVHRRRGPAQDTRGDTYKEPVSNIYIATTHMSSRFEPAALVRSAFASVHLAKSA